MKLSHRVKVDFTDHSGICYRVCKYILRVTSVVGRMGVQLGAGAGAGAGAVAVYNLFFIY